MWHKFLLSCSRQYLQRRVRRRPPRPLAELDPAAVRRVLLISATALGDTMFSTPAIRALKERYPDWELEVLGHRVFGALLSHNPHVARVWAYPGRNRRLLRLVRELRGRHFGLVIILHGNDPEATLVAHLTGSPFIIGSAGSPLAFAYSARVEPPPDPLAHAIERRLDAVRLLGADTADKAHGPVPDAGGTPMRRRPSWPGISGRRPRGSWPCIPPAPTPINGGRRRISLPWAITWPQPTGPRC